MFTTIGWATTLFLVTKRWWRQRQAWQWWREQQRSQSHEHAEYIRNVLLQQMFAFRRFLESTRSSQSETEQTDLWLDRLQSYYQSLESLSNELSPPFIADSLPLALQFTLKNWQQSHPERHLQLDLPNDWPYGSSRQNYFVVTLLTFLVHEAAAQHLKLALCSQAGQHLLTFVLQGPEGQNRQNIARTPEIKHLKEICNSLVAGQLKVEQEGRTLVGRLSWQDS